MNEWRSLAHRLREELDQLAAEVEGVRPLFDKLAECQPDEIELRAAALTLHGFYNGVEAIFLIIAKNVDHRVPEGVRWHRHLLDQMKASTDLREPVVDEEAYDRLLEYLSFRHIVRHTYPGSLSWDRFRDIAIDLQSAHETVHRCVQDFIARNPGQTDKPERSQ